jgi:uncharacterized protein (TIGR04255 family)
MKDGHKDIVNQQKQEKYGEFKNPPVIESWMEFEVDLTEESILWDEDTAKELMRKCFSEFPKMDFLGLAQVSVNQKTREVSQTGVSFERVKAFTESQDKCVQAGRNIFVFNHIKKETWPRFEERRGQVFDSLNKYMAFRQISKLRTVALHYKDMVKIPKDGKSEIKLEDYFTVCPRVPEETFGELSNFSFSLELPNFCEPAIIVLTIQSIPPQNSSDTHYQFAMDWHLVPKQKVTDVESSKEWLGNAHDGIYRAFIAAFTKKGLSLFD